MRDDKLRDIEDRLNIFISGEFILTGAQETDVKRAVERNNTLVSDTSEMIDFIVDIVDSKGDKGSRKYVLENKWCELAKRFFSLFGILEVGAVKIKNHMEKDN